MIEPIVARERPPMPSKWGPPAAPAGLGSRVPASRLDGAARIRKTVFSGIFSGKGPGLPDFVPAVAAASVPPGGAVEVTVAGRAVAIFNVGGTFHALANRCPHRGGPLGQGFVDGSQVSCPWHNYTFDVTTGENVVSADLKVPRYPVKVEDGQVYVKVE